MSFIRKVRRGLSSVVTSAILLTSVAVIGSSIVAWSNSNLSSFETALTNTAASDENQISESLSLENTVFCQNCGTSDSENVVNVTMTNTGTIPLNVTEILINGTVINYFYYSQISPYSSASCIHVNGVSHTNSPSGPSTCLPSEIMPGQSFIVSASLPSPLVWKGSDSETISAITSRGSIFATQAEAP